MSEVKKIATRASYGAALVELGKKHENLVVLDADLAAATQTGVFKKEFPERHIDCFIPTQVAKWLITNGAKNYAAVTGIDVDVFLKKTVSIIDRYGNMGASNIPVATSVAMEEGLIKENTQTLCMSVGVGISEAMMTVTF